MPVQSARQAVCVTMLGKQTWLGLVPGSKKGNNNRAWKKTPPNRDLALAGMMSSGKCEPGLILLNRGAGSPALVRAAVKRGAEVVAGDRVNRIVTHRRTGARQEVQVRATREWAFQHNCILFA